MEAFIVVKDHPYFSAVDSRGSYRLDGVPLGKFRLQVWHPQLGTTDTEIAIVRDGEPLDVNFDLKKKSRTRNPNRIGIDTISWERKTAKFMMGSVKTITKLTTAEKRVIALVSLA